MDISRPEPDDVEDVRNVTFRSMRASYAISPEEIDASMEEWFDESRLSAAFDEDDGEFLVARRDTDDGRGVVGYAEGRVANDGSIGLVEWVHVDPEARGEGIGMDLFEQLREQLSESGSEEVRARMLSANVEGQGFFEHLGMVLVDETTIEAGETEFDVEVYADESVVDPDDRLEDWDDLAEDRDDLEGAEIDPDALPETVDTDEGTFYVDQEETLTGSDGPFLLIYDRADQDQLYGYYCSICASTVEAMDGLGRIVCEVCGNVHRPDDWDDSYL